MASPALWSPQSPYLYALHAEIWTDDHLVDALAERIGFRDFRMKDGGFELNGAPVLLRGVGKHQETEYHLSAVTDDELREDFAHLKELGVNFVRLAHYPHARLAYDLADETGLLVWAENGHSNPWKVDVAAAETITREMVRQHYNHPSIVMWSVGNENAFMRVNPLAAAVKADDTSRLVVYASNTGVQGRKRQPNLDLITHNTYRGWYRGEPWDFEERALALRYMSESGGGAVVTNHTDHRPPATGSTRSSPRSTGRSWPRSTSRPSSATIPSRSRCTSCGSFATSRSTSTRAATPRACSPARTSRRTRISSTARS